MAKKKKTRKEDFYDDLYCTINGWEREYRFGINRHRWEFNNKIYDDWNRITIKGTVSHHITNHRANRWAILAVTANRRSH